MAEAMEASEDEAQVAAVSVEAVASMVVAEVSAEAAPSVVEAADSVEAVRSAAAMAASMVEVDSAMDTADSAAEVSSAAIASRSVSASRPGTGAIRTRMGIRIMVTPTMTATMDILRIRTILTRIRTAHTFPMSLRRPVRHERPSPIVDLIRRPLASQRRRAIPMSPTASGTISARGLLRPEN
jgi:hypothetical protein